MRIKQFFQDRDCPAHAYAEDFIAAADQQDLDWRLLPSLSLVESGGGKGARNNNLFGWNNCKDRFLNTREGIYRVAARLHHSRLYRNKSVDQLLRTYNPKSTYLKAVKKVMAQLGPADLAPVGAY